MKDWVNVLVRTSGRPNYFKGCYESISNQTYRKIRIIVSYDDEDTLSYVEEYNIYKSVYCERYDRSKMCRKEITPGFISYPAPYNLYFNKMMTLIDGGWIIYIDDDDKLVGEDSIERMIQYADNEDTMLLWRVLFPKGLLVPSDMNFSKPPVCRDISGLGIMFHSKYISDAQWDMYSMSDFRVINRLYNTIPNTVFLNKVLSGLQRNKANGNGLRDDINKPKITKLFSSIWKSFLNGVSVVSGFIHRFRCY